MEYFCENPKKYFYLLWIIFYLLALFFLLGWIIRSIQSKRKQRNKSKELFQIAKRNYEKGDKEEALRLLHAANAIHEHYANYELLGYIYEQIADYDSAAWAYDNARTTMRWKHHVDKVITYTYYKSAILYLKSDNYEFSSIRSNSGICEIASGHIPRYFNNYDIESELRMIRMLSGLYNSEKEVDKCSIIDDATWLMDNSKNSLEVEISRLILEIDSISRNEIIKYIKQWLNIDISYN